LRIDSAIVDVLSEGQSLKTMAGGTRHNASSSTAVPIVTDVPIAIAVTPTSKIAANQAWITFKRVKCRILMFVRPCVWSVTRSVSVRVSILIAGGVDVCETVQSNSAAPG
jgi:hypothetical protein